MITSTATAQSIVMQMLRGYCVLGLVYLVGFHLFGTNDVAEEIGVTGDDDVMFNASKVMDECNITARSPLWADVSRVRVLACF